MTKPLTTTFDAATAAVAPAPAVVWEARRTDAGLEACFVNDAAEALLQYPRAAWQGTADFWIGITHPDDRGRARRQLADALASAPAGPCLVRWLRADGTALSMEVHLVPVAGAAGVVSGVRGFALDASRWTRLRDELARAQEQLAYASRRATLNELVAALVHEISQPLNAILNNAQAAQLALDRPHVDPRHIATLLEDIVAADERASNIIRRARGLASRGECERSAVDLNAVAAEARELLASDALLRNVVVTAHPASAPCLVAGDAVQLTQVVVNVASNALEAASRVPVDRRAVDVAVVAPAGDWVWIAVVDSGPGIAPSILAGMFEPLRSTKAEGLGLGLDIASSIVQRHGGSMWAANNRDAGAHVLIALPRFQPAAPFASEVQP